MRAIVTTVLAVVLATSVTGCRFWWCNQYIDCAPSGSDCSAEASPKPSAPATPIVTTTPSAPAEPTAAPTVKATATPLPTPPPTPTPTPTPAAVCTGGAILDTTTNTCVTPVVSGGA